MLIARTSPAPSGRSVLPTGAPRRVTVLVAAGVVIGVTDLVLALAVVSGARTGLLLCLLGVALVAALLGLRDPVLASVYLLAATFFRLAVPPGTLPLDPFLPAFAGVMLSVWVWMRAAVPRRWHAGPIEVVMALYVVWSAISIVVPHRYPPTYPLDGAEIPVTRFVFVSAVIPFAMFVVGRLVFTTRSAARWLCMTSLAAGAYSAWVSIVQFHGPRSLAWPRYIVDAPNWPDRAGGVFNQPVVNGFVLIVGFLVANYVACARWERWLPRAVAVGIAVASAYAIYLTHTRAVWLAFALIVVCGAVAGGGLRPGYFLTAAAITLSIVLNWSTFTSEDRESGGVASPNEVQDRLNVIATAMHAFPEKPVMGWGIGRFPAVNTYHHEQWSPAIPWERGLGIASHVDVLGVAVELGIVGAILWVTLLTLLGTNLVRAVRLSRTPRERGYALTALLAFAALVVTGLTVDLRFFDFPNIFVMLLAGSAIGLAEGLGRTEVAGGARPASSHVTPGQGATW